MCSISRKRRFRVIFIKREVDYIHLLDKTRELIFQENIDLRSDEKFYSKSGYNGFF